MSSLEQPADRSDCQAGDQHLHDSPFLPRYRRSVLFLAICCLGISALITQLTLMRELVSAFSGNELVFGIVLGNWLLLTGIGSALGKTAHRLRSPVAVLILAQILVALLPIADVFLLRTLRDVFFLRGVEVGVTGTVASSFVLLAPYCLVAGYLLTLACLVLAPDAEDSSIGQVYFLDNIGDMLGGLLFTFILIYLLQHFAILSLPALLNLVSAGLVAVLARRPVLAAIAAVAALGLIALLVCCDLEDLSTRIQYADRHVVYRRNSPYGNLVVTESAGQYDFIHNGVPLFSTHNLEQREETVHYAMAQRPLARRVLLISGGVSGTTREILKYGVAAVDYVELDPQIIQVARQYVPQNLDDPRIHLFNTDGRLFVRQRAADPSAEPYDVVIVDVPDPLTFQLNRFYTREFFAEVHRLLAAEGVLAFSLGHYENYVSPELAEMLATANRTLEDVYDNSLLIPGGEIFFLASDGELTLDVAPRIQRAGVQTRLVKPDYLKAILSQDRLADLHRALSPDAALNRDFSPILYYRNLRFWMAKHTVRFGLFTAALLALLVVYLSRIRPVPLAIFTTGLAASALEVVLLVGFQILYGCLYHQVGLIVTMFMFGLGIGSYTMNRMLPRRTTRDLAKLELAIAVYAVCLPPAMIGLGQFDAAWAAAAARVLIPLAALLLAVLVGMEFPLAGKALLLAARPAGTRRGNLPAVSSSAARLYTADYVGAALGALLVSTLLIPLIGVVAVCLLAAGLNLLSGVVILISTRS